MASKWNSVSAGIRKVRNRGLEAYEGVELASDIWMCCRLHECVMNPALVVGVLLPLAIICKKLGVSAELLYSWPHHSSKATAQCNLHHALYPVLHV